MLAASTVAGYLAREKPPDAKDLFVFSAAIISAAMERDSAALGLAGESVAGLIDQLPDGESWEWCRGHLTALKETSWILRQVLPAADDDSANAPRHLARDLR